MDPLLSDLLKGKNENEFSSYDIASKAHFRWDKQEHYAAGILFEAASRVALQEFEKGISDKNDFLNYYSRAGICFNQNGDYQRSTPMLRESIEEDWFGAGLINDNNMIEKCFQELISQPANKNSADFEKLYYEAKRKCLKFEWDFPRIHPVQEQLLELAVDFNLKEVVIELINRIKNRKPISRTTRARIKEVEEMYS